MNEGHRVPEGSHPDRQAATSHHLDTPSRERGKSWLKQWLQKFGFKRHSHKDSGDTPIRFRQEREIRPDGYVRVTPVVERGTNGQETLRVASNQSPLHDISEILSLAPGQEGQSTGLPEGWSLIPEGKFDREQAITAFQEATAQLLREIAELAGQQTAEGGKKETN